MGCKNRVDKSSDRRQDPHDKTLLIALLFEATLKSFNDPCNPQFTTI